MSTLEEQRLYNESLEQSTEYKRILPEVMNEVYILFVNERIEQDKKWLEMDSSDDPFTDDSDESMKVSIRERVGEAQRLLSENPAQAADLISQLGDCHKFWDMQIFILKEKYGITWYTPAELNPEIKYD